MLQHNTDTNLAPGLLVDPWALQSRLMEITAQHQPDHPQLTLSSVTYAALIAEEAGEALQAFGTLLGATQHDGNPKAQALLNHLSDLFDTLGRQLQGESKLVRSLMKGAEVDLAGVAFEPCVLPTHQHLMQEFADGLTDLHVVTAGAELSTGIDGQQTYAECWRSNWSKRNPATGRIDIDQSGKWIKGERFTPPDLASVLFPKG